MSKLALGSRTKNYKGLLLIETFHQEKNLQVDEHNAFIKNNREVDISNENAANTEVTILDKCSEVLDKERHFLLLEDLINLMTKNVEKYGNSTYDNLLKLKDIRKSKY